MREIKDFNDVHLAMQDKAVRELIAFAVVFVLIVVVVVAA
jgi:hypothetical protein